MRRSTIALAVVCCFTSSAKAEQDSELIEVIVTANKQEEKLNKVPSSISVITADDIKDQGMRSLEDVAAVVPGLDFQSNGQTNLMSPVMRGLTANVISYSSSAALVIDGVATTRAQGFESSLVGVDRIEVLKGPQSTLYGKNAEAGVINIVTRKFDNNPYASVSLEAGSRNKQLARVDTSYALLPDQLYVGFAGEFLSQDGFINNANTGKTEDDRESRNGRFSMRWSPSQRTEANLRISQANTDDGGSQYGLTSASRYTVKSGTPSWNRSLAKTSSLDLSHEFDSGIKVKSITAQNEFYDRLFQDTDFMPANLMSVQRDNSFKTRSQEFRVEGKLGHATWLTGLYFDKTDTNLWFQYRQMGTLRPATTSYQTGNTQAIFTHWTIPLSEKWSFTAGGRLERNDVDFNMAGISSQNRTWSHFSPKLSLQYAVTQDAMIFTTLSEGFRAGGFNTFGPSTNLSYGEEKVHSYEIGLKGSLQNKRLNYSLASYFMNIDNMQVQQMGPIMGQVYVSNAAKGRSSGTEAEIKWLLGSGWQAQAAVNFNHTRFVNFKDGNNDYSGNRNPFAPDVTGSLGVRYDWFQGWFAQAQVSGSSKVYTNAANTSSYVRPGFGLINLSSGYSWKKSELVAYVKNAANKQYDTVGWPFTTPSSSTTYSSPRELGVRLNWKF